MNRSAWFCPSCQKHHAPHVETCPVEVSDPWGLRHLPTVKPYIADQPAPSCPKCGISLDGVMGYACQRAGCPTGLGGATCGPSYQLGPVPEMKGVVTLW